MKKLMRANAANKSFVVLVLVVIALAGVVGHRFYNEPKLAVGTLAPQTIYAPVSAQVEDTETTQLQREAARRDTEPRLRVDEIATQQVTRNLAQQLDQGNQLRQLADPFPFVETSTLSTPVQVYLRRSSDVEWQSILATVQNQKSGTQPLASVAQQFSSGDPGSTPARSLSELKAYQTKADPQATAQLLNTIAQARQRYRDALNKLLKFPAYDSLLLSLSDQAWARTQQVTLRAAERILTQGIPAGLPQATIQAAVRVNLSALSPPEQGLATQLLSAVLKPTLVVDPIATRQLAEQAARQVQPLMLNIRQGEVIVRSGEPIDQRDFVLLDHFKLTRREVNWLGVMATGVLVTVSLGVFWLVKTQLRVLLCQRDYVLILLLAVSVLLSVWVSGGEHISLPVVGLLVGSFYGSTLGLTVVGLSAVLTSLEIDSNWLELLPSVASSLIAAGMAGQLRSREELALLGGGVGLVQGITYLLCNSTLGLVWYSLLGAAAWQSLLGLGWSIVALGISPYLEHLFDLVTPIRLAELANHNRPTLKRLALEAPGTFQHTLLVASLAEAAARALKCNVELVRAGTLYHDIGKLHDPFSFIENQMGGSNKHDAINDPWQSAAVIKKHVTEGLAMARKCRLPKAVQAFIPEHQGTLLIAYFYHEAQRQGLKPVLESDFRYAGPVPQSRETGIVMLADACEAALRSLKEVSPEDALVTVKKIFKARWQDQQLVDSGLTRREVSQIAEIFIRVWQQFNHQRIRYPSPMPATSKNS